MTLTLYTLPNHPGAHIINSMRDVSDTDPAATYTVADVQLIGAPLAFTAPLSDLRIFTPAASLPNDDSQDIITRLAQEAITVYGLDLQRIIKAAELARGRNNILPARRDYMDQPIKNASLKLLCVRGSKGWYLVTRGSCTCPDNRGHVCKHRIAAWIYRETIARPLAKARRTTTAKILQELEA